MNQRYMAAVILLFGTVASCSHAAPSAQPVGHASIGDFADHILEPMALRVADEKISEASAELKLARMPKTSTQTLAGLLHQLPWVGSVLNFSSASKKAKLEEDLTWLETRRIPLKRELLDRFVSRTTQEGDTFTFCVDHVQRRYQALDTTRFTRLPDGPGPCEYAPLLTLRKDK